jgi:hypothetical protein
MSLKAPFLAGSSVGAPPSPSRGRGYYVPHVIGKRYNSPNTPYKRKVETCSSPRLYHQLGNPNFLVVFVGVNCFEKIKNERLKKKN